MYPNETVLQEWLEAVRVMVRLHDGIDLGVWSRPRPAMLMMPVNTHIVAVARPMDITRGSTADWKMSKEITARPRILAPEDPVKYDFRSAARAY